MILVNGFIDNCDRISPYFIIRHKCISFFGFSASSNYILLIMPTLLQQNNSSITKLSSRDDILFLN
jgi:hypothetical protein